MVGAIIVFDVTDEETLDAAKTWAKELKEFAENDITIAIAGNKCDLVQSPAVHEAVDQ